jgi:UDP-N-acetylglucosamine acyltransferase
MIGGGSRIPQDVAPFTLVAGNPAVAYGLNTIGLSRRGFSEEAIKALKAAYRILFRKKILISEALELLRQNGAATPEVQQLVAFIQASERGVTR